MRNFKAFFSIGLPVSILAVVFIGGLVYITTAVPDPSEKLIKEWLSTHSSVPPVSFHNPYRDGTALVYAVTREKIVSAVIDGTLSEHNDIVELSGVNDGGHPVEVIYTGITRLTIGTPTVVRAGGQIGVINGGEIAAAILRIDVNVDHKLLQPPLVLRPFPRVNIF